MSLLAISMSVCFTKHNNNCPTWFSGKKCSPCRYWKSPPYPVSYERLKNNIPENTYTEQEHR